MVEAPRGAPALLARVCSRQESNTTANRFSAGRHYASSRAGATLAGRVRLTCASIRDARGILTHAHHTPTVRDSSHAPSLHLRRRLDGGGGVHAAALHAAAHPALLFLITAHQLWVARVAMPALGTKHSVMEYSWSVVA